MNKARLAEAGRGLFKKQNLPCAGWHKGEVADFPLYAERVCRVCLKRQDSRKDDKKQNGTKQRMLKLYK